MNDNEDDYIDEHPSILMDDRATVRVKKGEEINITRLDPAIREVTAGIGWDLKKFEGDPIDVDASVFLLDRTGKTREDEDFIFYNNLTGCAGAVRHMGDSRTGAGDGDDEKIVIDLMALPFEVMKIVFVLSIYDMDLNANDFSMVKNVYFRIVNNETKLETFRFDLDSDLGRGTALYIGYLERIGSDWVYRAVGDSVMGGLAKVAADHGIIVLQNVSA